jgi:hypothetical protein
MMNPQSSSAAYPVVLEIDAPQRFERVQLLLRVLVFIACGTLHNSLGGSLYLLLPIVAAVLISQRNGGAYLERDQRWLVSALEWVVALYAYMLCLTDRFPLEPGRRGVRLDVRVSGTPTVGSALCRLLTSLPHALILMLFGIVSAFVSLFAAVSILLTEQYPAPLRAFQRGYAGWIARVFAYHLSLVEAYPPFAMEPDSMRPQPAA